MKRVSATCAAAAAAILALVLAVAAQPGADDPSAFFHPEVTLSQSDLTALAAGRAVAKTVAAEDQEVAVFSAIRIAAPAEAVVAWIRRIEELKKSEYVQAISRFSTPPQATDVAALTLEDAELDAVRRCQPGDCDLKLSAAEMADLRVRADRAGGEWRRAVQDGFRQAVLARAQRYLESGLAGAAPYEDQDEPLSLGREFEALLSHSPFLRAGRPRLADHLAGFPHQRDPSFEDFLYWSKERLGGRPLVSITHVTIARDQSGDGPEVLVAARQVYASHYMTGSLAITAVTGAAGGPRHLVYLNRSRLDVLDGFLGGLVRRIVQRRLRGESAEVIQGLRRRLESPPPR